VYLLIDLETIRDRSLPERASDDFPPAPYHQIVCIGWLSLDVEAEIVRIGASVGAEAPILSRLTASSLISTPERSHRRGSPAVTLVTFNGRRFDLPVLVARCLKHGISWPWYWQEKSARIRYASDAHIDISDELGEFGAAQATGLDTWSRMVGLHGKTANGSDVEALVAAGRWHDLASYCCNDNRMNAGLLLRWLVVRGRIGADVEERMRAAVLAAEMRVQHENG
jgi:predicted PolB exonuclease-like 3'-5' exonuclease